MLLLLARHPEHWLVAAGEEAAKTPAKKKRRKSAEAEPAAAAPPSEADIAASWRLRTQVLETRAGAANSTSSTETCPDIMSFHKRCESAHTSLVCMQALLALEQLFTHDSVGFLDEARFQRLLPPLVAQLHGTPPPELAASLAALLPPNLSAPPVDAAPAGSDVMAVAAPDAAEDPFGAAAVAALTRMAGAAGSDVMYRPLNRAVRLPSACIRVEKRSTSGHEYANRVFLFGATVDLHQQAAC